MSMRRAAALSGRVSTLQCWQMTRTSRCASTASTVLATRYAATSRSSRRVSAVGASLVCSVDSTRWPVSDACVAICAVSASRISPTRMMSGSWRSSARSAPANVMPTFSFTGTCGTPAQLVLDRIFDREDFLTPRADHLDRRVERRRLSGAGRTGDEHDAVRTRHDLREQLERVGRHPELGERDAAALLVEQTEHDALAAQRRHGRDAHVDLAVLQSQPNASVLRQPALGDVQLGHDLEAADDRRREMRRRRRRVLQHAVDAIAHAQSVLVRPRGGRPTRARRALR